MFDDRVQSYDFAFDRSYQNDPRNKFLERIGRGNRVLEVGCATGQVSAYMTQELGCEVVGIELSAEAARHAERWCSEVIVADIEKDALERVKGLFDVVTFGDVLEHLIAPGAVLSRCKRVLKPHGFILISIPNIAHYSIRLSLLRGKFEYRQYGIMDRTHLRFFTLQSARRMIEEAGFLVQDFDLVYITRGMRFITAGGRLERLVKKRFPELVGYQFVFKAAIRREETDGRPAS